MVDLKPGAGKKRKGVETVPVKPPTAEPESVKPPTAEPEPKRSREQPQIPVKDADDPMDSAATPVVMIPNAPPPATAGKVPLPRIPSDDPGGGAATPARTVISSVVPWVLENLQEYMRKHRGVFDEVADLPLHEHKPLLIEEKKNTGSLKSYKAPWDKGAASDALATAGMYEAAGNIVWARVFPVSQEMETVAGAPVAFEQVVELADHFFTTDAFVATQGTAVPEGQNAAVPRIVFPITMHVNASADLNIGNASHFNSCLDLITGHAFLYAWWYAMFRAVRDDATTLVASLWQCGLTTTIHLRQGLTVQCMAGISCAQSELHKSAEKSQSDSFPAFALKALLIAPSGKDQSRTEILLKSGIRYNGSVVNKARVNWFTHSRSGCVVSHTTTTPSFLPLYSPMTLPGWCGNGTVKSGIH